MKSRIIVLVAMGLVLAIIAGAIIVLFSSKKQLDAGEFSLANYQWEIETFPSDKNVGRVDDANVAVEKAKELWLDKFSMVNGQPYNPVNGRKIKVSYDSENDCWLINGTLPSNTKGSVPCALIQKDGKVLAIWMG